MYRILIVDDETYVVDWLSALLESRSEPELDVCRAYSAADALEWLHRAKIDIVITDIQMPDISGIALAEKVRLNWPHCKLIFLTAHAEFDYAYEAIKNNVVGYILKTEDDEYILATVDKAIALLEKEIKSSELLGQIQNRLKGSMSVIRKEILLSILKEDADDPGELFKQLCGVGSPISARKPFILFAGRIENRLSDTDIVERFRQYGSVQKIVENYACQYFHCECVEYSYNKIVWLLQKKSERSDSQEKAALTGREILFVSGLLEAIQHSCMDNSGLCVSFILHGRLLNAENLPENFRRLDRLLNFNEAGDTGFIITDDRTAASTADDGSGAEIDSGKTAIPDLSGKLKTFLENNNREEYREEFDKITAVLDKISSWHSNIAQEIYFSAAAAIISYINQHGLAEKIAFHVGLNGLFQPQSAGSWSGAAAYLRHVSQVLFDLHKEDQGRFSNSLVRFLRNYIEKHVTEDVSLVRLSEVSGYNASYLSRFFKENTGETLNDFIGRKKMSRIRELMRDVSLNIGDIAAKAGFDSRTYFNRFIKRETGLSPQEYREQVLAG